MEGSGDKDAGPDRVREKGNVTVSEIDRRTEQGEETVCRSSSLFLIVVRVEKEKQGQRSRKQKQDKLRLRKSNTLTGQQPGVSNI